MGMYDEIGIRCPSCGHVVVFQSKAGECVLEQYEQDAVPVAIAADIEGDSWSCPGCGKRVVARRLVKLDVVPMVGSEW